MILHLVFLLEVLCQCNVCGCSFLDVPITDRRDAPLQAIKLRYSDETFLKVAHIPVSFSFICVEVDKYFFEEPLADCKGYF